MAIFVIIECDGYDEAPEHRIVWAKDCGLEEAKAVFWNLEAVQSWATKHNLSSIDFWNRELGERRADDDTTISKVHWVALHRTPA